MAEVTNYTDQLDDLINAVEDLSGAFKSSKLDLKLPPQPAPVIRMDAPSAPVPVINIEPQVTVSHDRGAYSVTVEERDIAGKIKRMRITPV